MRQLSKNQIKNKQQKKKHKKTEKAKYIYIIWL